ncbi:MAG TPA: hypothetical protein VFW23_17470 [Tepidisphaeraceae bacterium]|nr:hypothetical protein [Tepidisphaeraceae bacterium]
MITRRLLETFAMAIIGDSVLCILNPRGHTSLWLNGPAWWERTWRPIVRHPATTRLLGALGLGLGIWLAWKQEEPITRSHGANLKPLEHLTEALR